MNEIKCVATISSEAIELNLDGNPISIFLGGDIDFTPLAKNLTKLIESESVIDISWTGAEESTDKANVAKEVIDEIINSFNEVIKEQSDEDGENHP